MAEAAAEAAAAEPEAQPSIVTPGLMMPGGAVPAAEAAVPPMGGRNVEQTPGAVTAEQRIENALRVLNGDAASEPERAASPPRPTAGERNLSLLRQHPRFNE